MLTWSMSKTKEKHHEVYKVYRFYMKTYLWPVYPLYTCTPTTVLAFMSWDRDLWMYTKTHTGRRLRSSRALSQPRFKCNLWTMWMHIFSINYATFHWFICSQETGEITNECVRKKKTASCCHRLPSSFMYDAFNCPFSDKLVPVFPQQGSIKGTLFVSKLLHNEKRCNAGHWWDSEKGKL